MARRCGWRAPMACFNKGASNDSVDARGRRERLPARETRRRLGGMACAAIRHSSAANAASASTNLLVAEQPIAGIMRLDEIDRMFDRLSEPGDAPTPAKFDLTPASRRGRRPIKGVRHFLSETEGSGYWDFFKLADYLILSVTDATYRQDHWIQVDGARFFKLRLLLAGRLLDARREVQISGPQSLMHLSPGQSQSGNGYHVAAGQPTRLVVLHCRTELLTRTLGLAPADLPPPIDTMLDVGAPSSVHPIGFAPEMLQAAQRIIDSRHGLPSTLRAAFLESMAMAILCEALGDLSNRDLVRSSPLRLHARDLNRLFEARNYLAQHYAAPPTIPQLARMMGINQTKLKAGFKQAHGLTIYEYIFKCRMERGAELLLSHDYNIAEVAYRVGYEHPANFACAFKKYFGCRPSAWKRNEPSAPNLAVSQPQHARHVTIV